MNALNMSNQGYLLLFHSNEWYNHISRAELQKIMAEKDVWFERLVAQGKIKGGQALARKGTMVSGKNGSRRSDGPFAESKEIIGGYLLLNVETLAEAAAIAQGHPGLAYGGQIEVRALTDVCPLDARLEALTREEELATV